MSERRLQLIELVQSDQRYALEAYEFVWAALEFTQRRLGRHPAPGDASRQLRHVTCRELALGIRDFALEQFGMMAYVVFRQWGITKTADFGEMVHRLIDAGLWKKSPSDRLTDFNEVFDLEQAFVRDFVFEKEEP